MSYSLTKEDVMVLAKKEHIKYEDACKEIETHITLNKQLLEDIDKAGKEIERLNNIIKEAREYLKQYMEFFATNDKGYEILKILYKGEKE